MFFSYWLVLSLPLLVFPLVSQEHYAQLFQREKEAVGADNAAIALGESDTAWLESLELANTQLARWEKVHHAWHACGHFPPSAVKCRPADLAWEAAIRARHAEAGAAAQLAWQRATTRSRDELARLNARRVNLRRGPLAPLRAQLCPVCRLPVAWRVPLPLRSQVVDALSQKTLTVEVNRQGGQFAYGFQ